jgi:hypothetical protein
LRQQSSWLSAAPLATHQLAKIGALQQWGMSLDVMPGIGKEVHLTAQ